MPKPLSQILSENAKGLEYLAAMTGKESGMNETKEIKVQVGTSDSADFSKFTWTFTMEGPYAVGAGLYAIMPISEYERLMDVRRNGLQDSVLMTGCNDRP